MDVKSLEIKQYRIKDKEALIKAEDRFLDRTEEYFPWAQDTDLSQVCETVIPDRAGTWVTPLLLTVSRHNNTIGVKNICIKTEKYIKAEKGADTDILSIRTRIEDGQITLITITRTYNGTLNLKGLYAFLGEKLATPLEKKKAAVKKGHLIIPERLRGYTVSADDKVKYDSYVKMEEEAYDDATVERPFLNSIDTFLPKTMPDPIKDAVLTYKAASIYDDISIVSPIEKFKATFRSVMNFVMNTEYYTYLNAITGDSTEESFLKFLRQNLVDNYVTPGDFPEEDIDEMLKVLNQALFRLYIVQDLIDDPDITDIKITDWQSIRVRVKGKAYSTDLSFLDENDYVRFINVLAMRNGIKLNVPSQTFTDKRDKRYVLRFTMYASYVTGNNEPTVHIRKVSRKKPLGDDLIKLGMMEPKVRDYLLDCGKNSRGVVFAGPPGSGKSICLNFFLEEAYEDSAEILVIQENDELFAYRKGVMFQHVVHYTTDRGTAVNLEELGQLALVAGANVFIIGEAKGAEICSAITLANSGCRTAITIHSPSSTETIDKMADLAMRGYAKSKEEAYRMLKSFQTIVYLQDFKVQEISEITGYDEDRKQMIYKPIYRRGA